jgi:hypothetical protein
VTGEPGNSSRNEIPVSHDKVILGSSGIAPKNGISILHDQKKTIHIKFQKRI